MKKIIVALILFTSMFIMQVNAQENIYYKNENDVEFTKEEYDFFSVFFYEGYQKLVTKEEFASYDKESMKAELVESNYSNLIMPFDATHNTTNKTLKISNNGSRISLVATWKNDPKVRSYDVIGVYLDRPSFTGNLKTSLSYSSGSYSSNEKNGFYNGFGVSIKLPSSGSNIIISQSFSYSGSGTVYGSYQHAKSNVTLAQSKKYTIDRNGYGGVFSFYDGMASIYDAMGGVSIDV